MNVSFTIPDWVFVALQVYLTIGALSFIPLNHWAYRFISPRREGWAVWEDTRPTRFLRYLLANGLLWPAFLHDCLRNEWRYGLGQKWRHARCHRRLDGCCGSCGGRGVGGSASVGSHGGACWDCRGTGHPHA